MRAGFNAFEAFTGGTGTGREENEIETPYWQATKKPFISETSKVKVKPD